MNVPRRERGQRVTEMLDALEVLWSRDDASFKGRFYEFENVTIEPKPWQKRRPPIWIGGGTQPSERLYAQPSANITRVLQRIARYADAWVPHSSATPDMVKRDWDDLAVFMHDEGREPEALQRVYSNFVYPLRKDEPPEAAVAAFSTFSGMDLEYWREHYLLGDTQELVERINRRIHSLAEWTG